VASASCVADHAVLRVAAVEPSSLASELGIEPGTELLAINGRVLEDFLDFEFLAADDAFLLHVRTPAGEEIEFDVERPEDLPLGITLEPPTIRRCANRCDFCFVDGNPEGARRSLSIRDDDYRLSFRHGNFATLTNLRPQDVDRIIEYRLSPLYVSVHATDPAVRRRLLRNPRAPAVLEQLAMFAARGIRFHTQIVLVPGVNDGAVLDRSLADLFATGETVLTVAVVPVALTAHSKLDLVRVLTRSEAAGAVDTVERWSARARRERGTGWVYGSDELYLEADRPLPPAEAYDGFPQAENGVGAVRQLQQLIEEGRGGLADLRGRRALVCTGTGMARLMPPILETVAAATGGAFECVVLENSFFGPSVTTAGLLPGSAFLDALRGREGYDVALLPAEAVSDAGVFMDDLSLAEVEAAAPMPVRLSYHFTDALGAERAA
jgi:putative radical SAM enzyme (TIGR03279 family)